MTVGTANPTTYSVPLGTWAAFNGAATATLAASAVAYVTDSSNSTFMRATAIPSAYAYLKYGTYSSVPSSASSAISRVRIGAVVKNGDGNAIVLECGVGTGTDFNSNQTGYYPNSTTAATVYTGWQARSTPISQAAAQAVNAGLISWSTACRFTKVWQEYDLVSLPTGTPTVTSNTTDKPVITWTFADTDGGVQASAVAKVFTSAQMAASGFSASTSTPLWSGTVIGTAATITPGTGIVTNGLVYRPFLQVFKDLPPTSVPSAISSATSTTTASITTPSAPSLSTTYSSSTSRTFVTATTSGTFRTVIFQGTALGTALDPAYRLLKDTTADGTGGISVYDYYMPRGTAVVYGSYVVNTSSPFNASAVTYSTVTTGSATTWELRSVNDPATVYNLALPVTGIQFDQYEGQTVYRPLGSPYPVVTSGDIGGDDGSMTIVTTNQTTWDNIKAMFDLQSDLYLTSPFVDSTGIARRWFIRVTGRTWAESGIPSAQVRTASVSFVEVAAPIVTAT